MMGTVSAAPAPNRWLIALMGTLLQVCLGTVYAWSFFQNPLKDTYHWTNAQVAWVFSTAICFLGLAAAWGGINLAKYGPRKLAMAGGILFGAGYLLGALALRLESLPLLYLGYGVIGGIGNGLGYVTPIAVLVRWFPDKRGFITGLAVMGFGFGAALLGQIAPFLIPKTAMVNGALAITEAGFGLANTFCTNGSPSANLRAISCRVMTT